MLWVQNYEYNFCDNFVDPDKKYAAIGDKSMGNLKAERRVIAQWDENKLSVQS